MCGIVLSRSCDVGHRLKARPSRASRHLNTNWPITLAGATASQASDSNRITSHECLANQCALRAWRPARRSAPRTRRGPPARRRAGAPPARPWPCRRRPPPGSVATSSTLERSIAICTSRSWWRPSRSWRPLSDFTNGVHRLLVEQLDPEQLEQVAQLLALLAQLVVVLGGAGALDRAPHAPRSACRPCGSACPRPRRSAASAAGRSCERALHQRLQQPLPVLEQLGRRAPSAAPGSCRRAPPAGCGRAPGPAGPGRRACASGSIVAQDVEVLEVDVQVAGGPGRLLQPAKLGAKAGQLRAAGTPRRADAGRSGVRRTAIRSWCRCSGSSPLIDPSMLSPMTSSSRRRTATAPASARWSWASGTSTLALTTAVLIDHQLRPRRRQRPRRSRPR